MVSAISFFGLFTVLTTEALSLFHLLSRGPVAAIWVSLAAIALFRVRSSLSRPVRPDFTPQAAALAAIAAITLGLGLISPPRHPDATVYHLPRVLHWIQNASVGAYPTHIDRQIWIGAGAEYFLVHLRLLAGTDAIAPLIQWLAYVGLAPLVSLIARELGASRRGQGFAALFALTLPMAITQSTGVQVDLVASFWLGVSVVLLLRLRRQGIAASTWVDALAFGSAAGLAVLAKAVNAIYLMPFVIWTVVGLFRSGTARRVVALTGLAMVPAIAVNAGHASRNVSVWGNALGVPERYGLANEIITPASVTSNVVRNLSIHASTGFQAWNGLVYAGVAKLHDLIGIDQDDRRTTYGSTHYLVQQTLYDEGVAPNRWHMLLIVAAIVLAWRKRARPALVVLGCLVVGALVFSAYLKWQPWHSRLHLPLFVISAGAVAVALERSIGERALKRVGWFLIAFAMFPVLRNGFAPIVSRHPVFLAPYESRLFLGEAGADVLPKAADLIASNGCARVGLLWQGSVPEYPVWNLLQSRMDGVEIRHVLVSNGTERMASARDRFFRPCALLSVTPIRGAAPVIPPGFRAAMSHSRFTLWIAERS